MRTSETHLIIFLLWNPWKY